MNIEEKKKRGIEVFLFFLLMCLEVLKHLNLLRKGLLAQIRELQEKAIHYIHCTQPHESEDYKNYMHTLIT